MKAECRGRGGKKGINWILPDSLSKRGRGIFFSSLQTSKLTPNQNHLFGLDGTQNLNSAFPEVSKMGIQLLPKPTSIILVLIHTKNSVQDLQNLHLAAKLNTRQHKWSLTELLQLQVLFYKIKWFFFFPLKCNWFCSTTTEVKHSEIRNWRQNSYSRSDAVHNQPI